MCEVAKSGRARARQWWRHITLRRHSNDACKPAGHLRCAETGLLCFCSQECQQSAEAMPGSPSLAVRRQLAAAQWNKLDCDDAHRLQLLLQFVALRRAAAGGNTGAGQRLQAFLALARGEAAENESEAHERLYGCLRAAASGGLLLTEGGVAEIVARDAVNAFGIEVPNSPEVRILLCCCGVRNVMGRKGRA